MASMKKYLTFFVVLLFVFSIGTRLYNRSEKDTISPRASKESFHSEKHYLYRHAYFGDLHIRTAWTYDAPAFGNSSGPKQAYSYAKGHPIKHPSGFEISLTRPLDFIAITDRAEYYGLTAFLKNYPNHSITEHNISKAYIDGTVEEKLQAFQLLEDSVTKREPIEELYFPEIIKTTWQEAIELAEQYNEPGVFTTFPAFQWTSHQKLGYASMHRMVICKDQNNTPETPFSTFQGKYPEQLWSWMDEQRNLGKELICIAHAPNLSDGLMFQRIDSFNNPITAEWAEQRMRNEPLVETSQIQGRAEAHPRLSPSDEFANLEISEGMVSIGKNRFDLKDGTPKGSYVRDALKEGLRISSQIGKNPYQFGILSSSDTQNSAAAYREDRHFGKIGKIDGTPESRLQKEGAIPDLIRSWGSAGLAGVWAESNTRESLFSALKRKETFGTTGPRIVIRFFGGWDFSPENIHSENLAEIGYKKGVPMGGNLPKRIHHTHVPSFIVWAIKDLEGANLDRIQIVKGWVVRGHVYEKIYNIAWSGDRTVEESTGDLPAVGNTVDLANATYTNDIGDKELYAFWTDPDFNESQQAFYYARVIEIPTPRWSTYDAVRLGIVPRSKLPSTIQEQAWTSPIWYTPDLSIKKREDPDAYTVKQFTENGIEPLTTEQLKSLIIGKTLSIKNLVNGDQYEGIYREDHIRTMRRLSGIATIYSASPGTATYSIEDGYLQTEWKDGRSFRIKIYPYNGKYYGAAEQDSGYLNYMFTTEE